MRKAHGTAGLVAAMLLSTAACAGGGTPLQLKPASQFDATQIAVKAILIGAMGVVVVGGALFAWRTWRRSQGMLLGPNDAAAVEWARRVSPRTTLLVVRWQGTRYLLAESTGHTTLIDRRALEASAP
jgi:hypothetical protein